MSTSKAIDGYPVKGEFVIKLIISSVTGKDLHLVHLDHARYEDNGAQLETMDSLDSGLIKIILPGIKEIPDQPDSLYISADFAPSIQRTDLTFIPYYAWNNRGVGEMSVYIRK
ncbi:MAG: hypothetical protein IKN76_05865 [Oscillospiraceae bacterium]|nr:hypothetical protein [Oscillospiraceae bacterium]